MSITDKEVYIFDIEADGLLDTITKIHCLSFSNEEGTHRDTLYSGKDIRDFFNSDYIFVGHYITGYDFKALNLIHKVEKPKLYADTLGLAWAMYPSRESYGLESFGEDFGVPKPEINDWTNLTIQEYTHRCETDVEINRILWNNLVKRLLEIYE